MRRIAVDTKPPRHIVARRRQTRLPLHIWRLLVLQTALIRPPRTRSVSRLTRLVGRSPLRLILPQRAPPPLLTQRAGTRVGRPSATPPHPPEKAVRTNVLLRPPVRPRPLFARPQQKTPPRQRVTRPETQRATRTKSDEIAAIPRTTRPLVGVTPHNPRRQRLGHKQTYVSDIRRKAAPPFGALRQHSAPINTPSDFYPNK